jgi:suppressor of ftsI
MVRCVTALLIAFAWLAGCGGHSSAPMNAMPPNTMAMPTASPNSVNELPEPPVVRSVNGVAHVSLSVTLSGATGFPEFVFNGMSGVAPTIRVNPGDTIKMDVANEMVGLHGGKHDINIHFHGMGSSPKSPGDDVLGMLAKPGESLHYVVHIPKNQEPGLYWYHPHVHGHTTYQVGSGGMSGAIVINGLEHHLPGLAKMKERMIIVRSTGNGHSAKPGADTSDDSDDMSSMTMDRVKPQVINSEPCGPDLGNATTLNGAFQPIIRIAPGEKQFFRVINASGHKTLELSDGGDLVLVAIDGYALDTWPGNPPTKTVKTIIMPPASRAEFIVTGPRNGFGTFRTLCYDTGPVGDHDPALRLGLLRAPPKQHSPPTVIGPLKVGAPLPSNVYTTSLPPIAHKRLVVFSESGKHFLINNRVFSMSDPPMYTVRVGTVEEWDIANISQEIHDFHLHQVHFLVKAKDDVPLAHPYWADSVVIPHRRTNGKPGTLVIIPDFRDPIIKGTFLFHCHILDHEDAGMMAKIQAI